MKKLLLVLFLITIITSPILAQKKENLSFDLKAGLGFNSNIILNDWYITGMNTTENFYIKNLDNFFSLEIEFCYYIFKNLSLGLGVNHCFDSKVTDMNYNFTNLFLAIKPEAYLNSEIFSSVYGVGKIGYGIINTSGTFYEEKLDIENGLYVGLGIGTTIIKSFIFECIYSINYNKINNSGFFDFSDLKYTTFILNIGYKFNIINN